MTSPLAKVFEEELPRLLAGGTGDAKQSIAFASTDGPETGYWIVSLAERTVRRGSESDEPDATVEGDGALLAMMFSGALDVGAAVRDGALTIHGDASALAALAETIGEG
jgi:hypothetical protein